MESMTSSERSSGGGSIAVRGPFLRSFRGGGDGAAAAEQSGAATRSAAGAGTQDGLAADEHGRLRLPTSAGKKITSMALSII